MLLFTGYWNSKHVTKILCCTCSAKLPHMSCKIEPCPVLPQRRGLLIFLRFEPQSNAYRSFVFGNNFFFLELTVKYEKMSVTSSFSQMFTIPFYVHTPCRLWKRKCKSFYKDRVKFCVTQRNLTL